MEVIKQRRAHSKHKIDKLLMEKYIQNQKLHKTLNDLYTIILYYKITKYSYISPGTVIMSVHVTRYVKRLNLALFVLFPVWNKICRNDWKHWITQTNWNLIFCCWKLSSLQLLMPWRQGWFVAI